MNNISPEGSQPSVEAITTLAFPLPEKRAAYPCFYIVIVMMEVSSFVFQNFTVLAPFLGALCDFFQSVILQLFVFSAPGISAERSSAIPVLLLDFPGLLVAYLSKFDAWQVL